MDDLIKRQDAITAYCEHECGIKGMTRENCGATDCGTIFDDIPSAQPRNGEWIDYSDEGYVECPFCHSATNCEGNKEELHYCFSCGAELR